MSGDTKDWAIEVKRQMLDSAEVKRHIAGQLSEEIASTALLIVDCFRSGGKLILFGNGGSAADAQHLAGEFVGRLRLERKALPAIALSTNTSIVTAVGNDYGFDTIFARQIEAWAEAGDVVVGISTSGESENVLKGIKKAKEAKAKTVGFTGKNGGQLAQIADIAIVVPSSDTRRIQESHIAIGHVMCDIVERVLFPTKKSR
jgi:D-sedoheptulose 7-phosphate isomerase